MATATKKQKKSNSGTQLQPLGDRVVLRREESEEKTSGGILLPDSAKDKPARGEIVSIGTGRLL
ncbi:MAG: co-chaperone GroES, partial [Planctomycetales bacterium]|nr:co-chaperone GroES [Planctomycetales bacterium]